MNLGGEVHGKEKERKPTTALSRTISKDTILWAFGDAE